MEAKLNFEASAAAEGLVRNKTSNLSVVGAPQASHASDTVVAEEEDRGTDLMKLIPTMSD